MDYTKKKTKRGRKPLVDLDAVYNVLKNRKNDIFSESGNVVSITEKVWYEISSELEGKLSPKSIFLSVFHNRNDWQTKLKNLLGIISTADISSNLTEDETISCSESSSSSIISNSGRKLFKFNLSYDLFRTIYPQTTVYKNNFKRRNYEILKPNAWVDVINDAFLLEHKLPCNFIYKRAKVFPETERSKHFITFSAKCKDERCGAILNGWSEFKPKEGEPLNICVLTKDTKGLETKHITKRPLKGLKRQIIGNEIENNLACNWRRSNVSNLEFGQISPPNLYGNNVLRKVKQETKDKKLGIVIKCPVQSLIEFKHNSRYSGSIYTIGIDPFVVHYWTSHQLTIYKDLSKTYCKLSLDATGGLIKKFKRSSMNLLSSHIFLYEAVINSNVGSIPVTQMISERQDTLTIFYWLGQWMKMSNHRPNEVVCDYSKALLGAVSRAFCNGSNLQTYVDNCFEILIGLDKHLPPTYIRIDVAHMMKVFCRIKQLSGIKNKILKEFYVRGLRVLLTSETLKEFSNVLEALLTVSLSETDGWHVGTEMNETPSEASRNLILEKIRGIQTEQILINQGENENDLEYFEDDNIYDVDDEPGPGLTDEYIKKIFKRSLQNSEVKGNRLSAYFLPDLAKHILRFCKDFPIWSNVMKNKFNSPYDVASSASVENDFKELKTQILKFDICPMTADRFVVKHLNSIEANSKLFKSSLIKYSEILNDDNTNSENRPVKKAKNTVIDEEFDKCSKKSLTIENDNSNLKSNNTVDKEYPEKSTDISTNSTCSLDTSSDENNSDISLNAIENWRGQGKEENTILLKTSNSRRRRPTKYMESVPEIDRILNSHHLRSKLNTLILNGNRSTPVRMNKKKYIAYNTCGFDSVAVMVSMAYIDIPSYKNFVDNSNNVFLTFSKQLALNNSCRKIYSDRISLLQNIFKEDCGITDVKLIDATCNVLFIVTNLLKNTPSSIEDIVCSKTDCKSIKKISSPSVILGIKNGFTNLENDLTHYLFKTYKCSENNCDGIINSSRSLQSHLFIETDVFADERLFSLLDFPSGLSVTSEKYRLCGAVGYEHGHYIAYVRRSNTCWEVHNDLLPKIKKISNPQKIFINPHLIMYVRL